MVKLFSQVSVFVFVLVFFWVLSAHVSTLLLAAALSFFATCFLHFGLGRVMSALVRVLFFFLLMVGFFLVSARPLI
jgi:hypothetical protein